MADLEAIVSGNTQVETDRAVIRSGHLDLRARELEPVKTEVDRMVQDARGWVAHWSLTERHLRMTLRIPESSLDAIMDEIATLGRVVGRGLQARDVTEQLIDLEARLKNLRALRDRLRGYLDRAENLKEILEVERELTRIQTEIERLEAQLERLQEQVAMSELRLSVKRRGFF